MRQLKPLALAFFAGVASTASAGTLTQHATGATTVGVYNAAPTKIAYQKFDPSWGTLTRADFSIVTTWAFGASWDESEMIAGHVYWSPSIRGGTATFAEGGAPTPLFPYWYRDELSLELLPGDVGGLDHGPLSQTAFATTSDAFDLGMITGLGATFGDVWANASNYSECLSYTCGPFETYFDLSFDVAVTYEFIPAPEPESWALLVGGFAMTGAAIRRRRMFNS